MAEQPTFCQSCGAHLSLGSRFCSQCGGQVTPEHQAGAAGATPSDRAAPPGELRWEVNMPLVNNRFMLYDIAKVWGITGLVMGGLVGLIMFYQGNMRSLVTALPVLGLVILGLFALCILVMLGFFGNRYPMEFLLSPQGLVFTSLSQRGKWANRSAVVLGLMGGKPGLAGAGLLAMSRENEGFSWEEVQRIKVYPEIRVITLMDSWHVVARLFCTPRNFEAVRDAVLTWTAAGISKRAKAARTAGPSPVPRLLAWSALMVVAAIAVAGLPVDTPALLPWILGVAGLLDLWVMPGRRLWGAVTLVAVAAAVVIFAAQALEMRQTTSAADFKKFAASRGGIVDQVPAWVLGKHRRYEIFGPQAWLQTGIAGFGLAFFGWLGLAAVRPRSPDGSGSHPS